MQSGLNLTWVAWSYSTLQRTFLKSSKIIIKFDTEKKLHGSLLWLVCLEVFSIPQENCPILFEHGNYASNTELNSFEVNLPKPHESKYLPLELKSIPVTLSLWAFRVAASHLCFNWTSLAFVDLKAVFFSVFVLDLEFFSVGFSALGLVSLKIDLYLLAVELSMLIRIVYLELQVHLPSWKIWCKRNRKVIQQLPLRS